MKNILEELREEALLSFHHFNNNYSVTDQFDSHETKLLKEIVNTTARRVAEEIKAEYNNNNGSQANCNALDNKCNEIISQSKGWTLVSIEDAYR